MPLTFSAKSFILDILSGPENASGFTVFNYFDQELQFRSLRGQRCLCMYIVPQIWRWINEISEVCYEETQKNVKFPGIAVRKISQISKKTSRWNCFFKESCRLPDTEWEFSSGKFMKFSEQLSQESFCNKMSLKNVSTKIYFSKNISFDFSHLCFHIQWHVLPRIKCITNVQELNIWIRRIFIFSTFTFKVEGKKYV